MNVGSSNETVVFSAMAASKISNAINIIRMNF